jgi:hypothetical protein
VHGTTLVLLNAARKYLQLNEDEKVAERPFAGKVYVSSGLGGMSGAQVLRLHAHIVFYDSHPIRHHLMHAFTVGMHACCRNLLSSGQGGSHCRPHQLHRRGGPGPARKAPETRLD